MENNAGKNKSSSHSLSVSKNLLLNVAKEVGIVVEDGNPILDTMISLDHSRPSNFAAVCGHNSCNGDSLEKR